MSIVSFQMERERVVDDTLNSTFSVSCLFLLSFRGANAIRIHREEDDGRICTSSREMLRSPWHMTCCLFKQHHLKQHCYTVHMTDDAVVGDILLGQGNAGVLEVEVL